MRRRFVAHTYFWPTRAQLASLVTLLPWLLARLAPRLLVVKSEALAAAAGDQLAREAAAGSGSGNGSGAAAGGASAAEGEPAAGGSGGGGDAVEEQHAGGGSGGVVAQLQLGQIADAAGWWARLELEAAAAQILENPLWYKAKAKGWRGVHPMRFPVRQAPGAAATVCRPHNYATCHVGGGGCPFDHGHCHHCLRPGHTAKQCGGGNGGSGGEGL